MVLTRQSRKDSVKQSPPSKSATATGFPSPLKLIVNRVSPAPGADLQISRAQFWAFALPPNPAIPAAVNKNSEIINSEFTTFFIRASVTKSLCLFIVFSMLYIPLNALFLPASAASRPRVIYSSAISLRRPKAYLLAVVSPRRTRRRSSAPHRPRSSPTLVFEFPPLQRGIQGDLNFFLLRIKRPLPSGFCSLSAARNLLLRYQLLASEGLLARSRFAAKNTPTIISPAPAAIIPHSERVGMLRDPEPPTFVNVQDPVLPGTRQTT